MTMRRHPLRFRLGALLLCLAAFPWIQQAIAADGTLCAIARAAGETGRVHQGNQVIQDGVQYVLEDGIAYATGYVSGEDVIIIPPYVEGLLVSLERVRRGRYPNAHRLILAEGIQQVSEGQFDNSGCEELVLPSTLKKIGPNAFSRMNKLKTLTIPEGVERIGDRAFGSAGMETVSLPSTVSEISPTAFDGCKSLKSFTVHPDNPSYAAVDGVLYSKDLKTLHFFPGAHGTTWTLPGNIETISKDAFRYNDMLQSLTISEGVRTLSEGAFGSCRALRVIRLSTTVDTIMENAIPTYWLKQLEIPEGNQHFQSVDGAVYSVRDSTLIFHRRNSDTTFSVLPGTKHIRADIFNMDDILESVSLPLGLESIGKGAFHRCASLASISLPLTLKHIGDSAFFDCVSLEWLMLPPGLQSIGARAFGQCTSLQALHIPASVTEIGKDAFTAAPQMTITADPGTPGEAHVRTGLPMRDPLGIPYQAAP